MTISKRFFFASMFISKGLSVKKKKSACQAGDASSIPGLGRSPGEGNPHQYSCLENPMDRGAWWWATVHGVTQSQTRFRN